MGIINAECGKTSVIAYQGENNRQQVRFDLSDIMGEFPGGTAVLAIRRCGDDDIVPALSTEMDGTSLLWTVTSWECANDGFLYAQVTYSVGSVVAKTKKYRFDVKDSLVVTSAEPSTWQDLVGQLVTAAEGVNSAIEAAEADLAAKVTAAEEAQGAAEIAQGKAKDAQRAAETAQGKAEDAQGAAETAQGAAEIAQGKAEDAQGAAETAQGKAEDAQSAAETAITHSPRITNGKWEVWDATEGAYVNTGVSATGEDGHGVPVGGTTGQVLKKRSGTDYDTEWSDEEGGDPTEIIDDTAGAGDTNKVWSADKSSELKNEINAKVSDVKVNGTSVVSQGVANVPMAGSNDLGVVKIPGEAYGIAINSGNGIVAIAKPTDDQVRIGSNSFRPIVPSLQHASAFYGLAKAAGDSTQASSENAVGTYTADALVKIQKMLGIYEAPWELIREDTATNAEEAEYVITVDGNGQPFELTDVVMQIIIPKNENVVLGSYGIIELYYSSGNYFVAELGAISNSSTTDRYGSAYMIQNKNSVLFFFAKYSGSGSARAISERNDAGFTLADRTVNKIRFRSLLGSVNYKIYGKRKWRT